MHSSLAEDVEYPFIWEHSFMIEKLKDSHGIAFGFKVTGSLTADDIVGISKEIDFVISEQK